jgi:hypothetical protein
MTARARGLFAGMLPVTAVMTAIVAGAPPAQAAGPGTISTVAGGPGRGLVRNVAQQATAVATAPDGSVYVSDGQGAIRQFNDTSTWEKAIAGVGLRGYGGDGGPATRVSLDGYGNLLIADTLNERVRLVAVTSGTYYGRAVAAGDVVTVAGNGVGGFLGDSGPATSARLQSPRAAGVDRAGNLLIADTGNDRIRAVSS